MSVAPSLLADLVEEPTVSWSMPMILQVVRALVKLPRTSVLRRFTLACYRQARWLSHDFVHGTEFRTRRSRAAARELLPVRTFLTAPAAGPPSGQRRAVRREIISCAASFLPRAVIFDIDGTIVDNMHLHAEAFAVFAERHGLPPLTTEDRARLDGRRNSEIFPILFKRDVPRDEWLAYEHEKEGLYRELSRGRLSPMNGLHRLIDRLKAERIPMALATSAPKLNVDAHAGGARSGRRVSDHRAR